VKIHGNGEVTIEERSLDFINIKAKKAEDLTNYITEKLKKDNIDLKNCRGQGYDNASVMSGAYTGVQQRIIEESKYAKFSPCLAHKLNLVGVEASKVTVQMVTFFGQCEHIFSFFSASTN